MPLFPPESPQFFSSCPALWGGMWGPLHRPPREAWVGLRVSRSWGLDHSICLSS